MRAYLPLFLFCLLLFGYSLVGGRPLTMHEARLPETAREMAAAKEFKGFLVPFSGDRPWVERPPLPHWLVMAVTAPVGGLRHVWQARLPNVLVGLLGVALVCAIAARLFDRATAVLAGALQATTWEYLCYAWLAEDDIYLCAVIYATLLVFVRLEFPAGGEGEAPAQSVPASPVGGGFLGRRPWAVALFFLLLGLTNMAKGPLFGTVIALVPVAGCLLFDFRWEALKRYLWLPGWLLFLVIAAWWFVVAERLSPGSWEVWHYDLFGRLAQGYIGAPWHYYLTHFPGIMAPWFVFGFLGIAQVWRARGASPLGRRRAAFLLSWAVLAIAVLSVPQGKHHHYLLSVTGAWAILGAIGLQMAGTRLAAWRPGVKRWLAPAMAAALLILAVAFCVVHSTLTIKSDRTAADTAFLRQVAAAVPPGQTLAIDAKGSMDFFRALFYLQGHDPEVITGLPCILDARRGWRGKEIMVITRAGRAETLHEYGETEELLRSAGSRRANGPEEDFALFKVRLRDDPPQIPWPPVTPMQAMERAPMPWEGNK